MIGGVDNVMEASWVRSLSFPPIWKSWEKIKDLTGFFLDNDDGDDVIMAWQS